MTLLTSIPVNVLTLVESIPVSLVLKEIHTHTPIHS